MNSQADNRNRLKGGAQEITVPLRRAAAQALMRLLRRPGLRPGGRAAGAAAMLVVALMLTIALWRGPAQPPAGGNGGAVPVSTDRADEYLTDAEIEKKIIDFLALNAWAEAAGTAAAENPQKFPEALTASPSPLCAAGHRAEAAAAESGLDRARAKLMDCIAGESGRAAAGRPLWEDMLPGEREARSRAALRMLWEAISPETTISTRIAWQTAAEVNRHNNEEFRLFIAEYAECGEIPDRLAPELATQASRQETAAAWLRAVAEMRDCAGRVNTRLFPAGTQ